MQVTEAYDEMRTDMCRSPKIYEAFARFCSDLREAAHVSADLCRCAQICADLRRPSQSRADLSSSMQICVDPSQQRPVQQRILPILDQIDFHWLHLKAISTKMPESRGGLFTGIHFLLCGMGGAVAGFGVPLYRSIRQ